MMLNQDRTPEENSEATEAPPQPAGDQITVKHIEERAAVAAGRGAKAQIFNINIQDIHWWPVIIALAGVIGLMAYLFLQLRPTKPDKMQGVFNVAIAEFTVQDQNGNPVHSDDGKKLASYLYQQVQTDFEELELQKVVPYGVWGPEDTGSIAGSTRAEREKAAANKANEIRAHVIIYGTLTDNGARSSFAPEFFVNHASFQEADEIVGQHELGTKLRLSLPLSGQIQSIENPALAGRAHALTLITLGLAYYAIDSFENAISYFEQAANDQRWLPSAGKEIIYLLLGNAYMGWHSIDGSQQHVADASTQYQKALEINDNYGRAKVGQAHVLYMLALQGDPPGSDVDLALLDDATRLLDEVSQLQNQPESANLESKTHFLQGMIGLVRYLNDSTGTERLVQAQDEFNHVIRDFEAGDIRIEGLAAHSYARLGYIAGLQQNYDLAIEYLRKAVEYASPFYEGKYYTWLASYYVENHQPDLAQEALEEAIAIAEANGDLERVEQYNRQLGGFLNRQQQDQEN